MAMNFRFKSTYKDADGEEDGTTYFAYFDNDKAVYFIVPHTYDTSVYEGTELTISEVADKIKNKEWVQV